MIVALSVSFMKNAMTVWTSSCACLTWVVPTIHAIWMKNESLEKFIIIQTCYRSRTGFTKTIQPEFKQRWFNSWLELRKTHITFRQFRALMISSHIFFHDWEKTKSTNPHFSYFYWHFLLERFKLNLSEATEINFPQATIEFIIIILSLMKKRKSV